MKENIYNPEFVKTLFNKMSTSYERMNYITSFGFSIRWRSQFLRALDSNKNKIELIDLLTGMGETWESIQKTFPDATISALDFSQGMLHSAKKKNERHFGNNILLLQQDVLENTIPGNHFDVVTCAFGLKTFDDIQLTKLAIEIKRILKPNGQFSFVEVSKPKNPVLKALYRFYLGKLIPVFGKLMLGDPTEYKMLWQYIDKFENAKNAMEIFRSQGLQVRYNSYFFGCATGFNGKK